MRFYIECIKKNKNTSRHAGGFIMYIQLPKKKIKIKYQFDKITPEFKTADVGIIIRKILRCEKY